MRVAVISDIHANLEALEAVCRMAEKRHVETWVCLGDIVGYGASPAACIDRIRQLTGQTVLGNHDAAAAGLINTAHFNTHARSAARWTASQLTPADRRYLVDQPLVRERGEALFVHAEPRFPEEWGYVFSRADAIEAMTAIDARCCFIGHSHQPLVWVLPGGTVSHRDWMECIAGDCREIALLPDRRFLINVGSVGQPRDGDPRACFVLWDDARGTLEFARVVYDIATAQQRIIAAGLPSMLAERLAIGH